MLNLLEKKREIIDLSEKEKGKIISVIKEKRIIIAIGQKTIKKTSIHHVSIWSLFSFYGYKTWHVN